MNGPRDPLETELAAFHPPGLSPEFRRRIDGRLSDQPRSRWPRRRPWTVALAACLAAACLAVVWLGRGGDDGGGRVPTVAAPPPGPQTAGDDPPPSVHAYRQALARSSEDLAALLDRHAARVTGSAHRPDRAALALSGGF